MTGTSSPEQLISGVEEPVTAVSPVQRKFFYGWVMLGISILAAAGSSPGQTFGVSIFNEPMRLALNLNHSQLAGAYMLGTLLGAIPITLIGHQMDRHGLRRTMLVVISVFSLGCLFTSFVQGWMSLVLAFCLLRMLGPGSLAFLSGNTLAFWFKKRLGMVEGMRQLGMAGAMASIPSLNLWLVDQWGWRGAYRILGISVWGILFPLVLLFFRNRPRDIGQQVDGAVHLVVDQQKRIPFEDLDWGLTLGETLHNGTFWIVAGGSALFGLIHTAFFFCVVPIFEERQLTANDAAVTLMVFAACLACMQLIGGTLADMVEAPRLLFTGLIGLGFSLMLFFMSHSRGIALWGGGVLGASQGIFFGATQPLWARYFGYIHLGKIRGVLMTINLAASSLGPFIAGVLRDLLGDFSPALLLFAIAPLPVAVLSLFIVKPRNAKHCRHSDLTPLFSANRIED